MTPGGRRALVVTVVHHPQDARIRHREIPALLDAGWRVTYAAPFTGYGEVATPTPGLTAVDLPRARGRRRLRALRAARRLLRERASDHDVVLLHDPELMLATARLDLPPVVWDVHEDTAAALPMKAWLPRPLARPTAAAVRAVERGAERRFGLLLAEDAYADRFRQPHPVVPNSARVPATVPAPDAPRVVYVGHLSLARGAAEMVALGRALRADGVGVELVGHADGTTTPLLEAAADAGDVVWHGFLPADRAAEVVRGATAGLSLLHDQANYRHSRPTKVVEYLASGVPAVTTPLPLAVAMVEESGGGLVVPFPAPVPSTDGAAPSGPRVPGPDDPCVAAALAAVRALRADPDRRHALGGAGHAWVREHLDWERHAPAFVAALGELADR